MPKFYHDCKVKRGLQLGEVIDVKIGVELKYSLTQSTLGNCSLEIVIEINMRLLPWPNSSKLVGKLGNEVWTAVLGSGHRRFQRVIALPIVKTVVHPNFANYHNDIGKIFSVANFIVMNW